MGENYLSPNYVDIDFLTLKERIKEQLEQSALFNNYKYEGSNITILIELISYLSELSTFYLNKIAQNVFIDSATIYENVSRLSQLVGCYPKGYRSSEGTLKLIILKNVPNNSVIKIPAWSQCWTAPPTEEDAYISGTQSIKFVVPSEVILDYPKDFTLNKDGFYEYDGIFVKQGIKRTFEYTGADLVDNQIYLPTINFDHDQNLSDDKPSVEVYVNDELWTRVNDFYERVSGLQRIDSVYTFRFNKYKDYVIEFSDIRRLPKLNDRIKVTLIETLGSEGNVGPNWISQGGNSFVTVETSSGLSYNLESSDYKIRNEKSTKGGDNYDDIDRIKKIAKDRAKAQYRCVTKEDYKTYLNEHDYIAVSNVWGEQDINFNTNGFIGNYNKVFISIVPVNPWAERLNYFIDKNNVIIATSYDESFLQSISEYLEPRKMLCAYEEYVVPDFVYFKFTVSMRLKSNYRFIEVRKDVRDKIEFYFNFQNRNFGEMISFNELTNYILDTSKVSSSNYFKKVAGILNLNIRDISIYDKTTSTWRNAYPANSDMFPRYINYDESYWDENLLKVIQLGPNQFPIVSIVNCIFLEEKY